MSGIKPEIEKRMLKTLKDKIAPENAMLIVIDMTNDFCAEGGMMDREGLNLTYAQQMAPHLKNLITAARKVHVPVLFVKNVYNCDGDWYLSDVWLEQAQRRRGQSYTTYRVCEPNSWGGSFYDGIEPLEGEPVVVKHRFNAFHATDLALILRSRGTRSVILTGVATNVCVETTARDAFVNDYYVVLASDCTATYNEDDQKQTLSNIDRNFGVVVPSCEIIQTWKNNF